MLTSRVPASARRSKGLRSRDIAGRRENILPEGGQASRQAARQPYRQPGSQANIQP